jgi:hypothetical protein
MHFEHLYSELRDIKFTTIEAFRLYLKASNQQMLDVAPIIDHLWEKLLNIVPTGTIEEVQEQSFSLTQKLSLPQWLEELKHFSPDGLFGEPDKRFVLPANLHSIEIWGGQRLVLPISAEVIAVDQYWWEIYAQLDRWQEIAQAKFQTAYWELKNSSVDFLIRWEGGFRYIEHYEPQNISVNIWKIIFPAEFPAHLSAASNVFLLRSQLLALIGGNSLIPIRLNDNILEVSLQMVRADMKSSPNRVQLVSEQEVDLINKHIYSLIIPDYLDTSKRLEAALSSEIDRLNPYVSAQKIDTQWIIRFSNTLNYLISIRKKLTNLID